MPKIETPELEYVFYHLNHHCTLTEHLRGYFYFDRSGIPDKKMPAVVFPLSITYPVTDNLITIRDIPVLFPVTDTGEFYYFDDRKNLIFNHDLLSSAFFLLSGRQEYKSDKKDALGRFPYAGSIQEQHNFVTRPVVNYYFDVIIQGLEKFCSLHGINFSRKNPFRHYAFFLSHDIDFIDEYNFWEVALKVKQLFFPAISPYNYSTSFLLAIKSLLHFSGLWRQKNSFWNFDWLMDLEKKYGINAAYYFLEKYGLHNNSRYHFSEMRIKRLVSELQENGHETGLHFIRQAAYDEQSLKENLQRYNASLNPDNKPVGGRFHTLQFEIPNSMNYLEKYGIVYDTTLGFATHEGFRNSYCFPFKLFDFENNRMNEVWEIPLIVMDTTLFNYRKYSLAEAQESLFFLKNEIKKFGGVLSILWHNTFFDERKFSGITLFYESVLKTITGDLPECIHGNEIITTMNGLDVE